MATHGEEGRGKLRKASVSRKQALTRRYPNGETHHINSMVLKTEYIGLIERNPLK